MHLHLPTLVMAEKVVIGFGIFSRNRRGLVIALIQNTMVSMALMKHGHILHIPSLGRD